jgi:DNA helicase-2/ATP-dependent DNA helicase PcrA
MTDNLFFDATKVKPAPVPADDIQDQPRNNERRWSAYQQAVFDKVEHGTGNAIVVAVAGSGKSTTIVEAMKLARGESIFLAFNKAIADELKKRGVNGRTFHSLVFGPVVRQCKQDGPTMDKLRRLQMEEWTPRDRKIYGSFAQRLVGLARGMGIGCLIPDTETQWIALAEHHDLEPDSDEADFGEAIVLARQLFNECCADPRVDFDDMLYRAVKDNINLPKFDFVFVDEAQDTNPIQRAILRKILKPTGRLIAVGDPAQAIYGFRGADSRALDTLATEFQAESLPLSITYRCPTSVVRYAKQWVSHIEARDGAPEGKVEDLGTNWNPLDFMPGDLVVCRKTAPLITAALRFIRAGVPVQVLGKDIGEGLKSLIRKMNARNIDHLGEKLEQYRQREVAKAIKEEDDAKVESINDKVGVLIFMIDNLLEDRRTLNDLEAGIDYLFTDKAKAVIFCTGHKSKGLEADRVFWLGRSECPAQWARKDWQRQQEVNLCYVITTRAKSELYLIELSSAAASGGSVSLRRRSISGPRGDAAQEAYERDASAAQLDNEEED